LKNQDPAGEGSKKQATEGDTGNSPIATEKGFIMGRLRLRKILYITSMLMALLCSACSHTVHRRDWSAYRGPGAEQFQKTEVDAGEFIDFSDPLERMNRSIGVFNHGVILGVADPLAKGYRFLIPKLVRESLTRFGTNILYPRHLLANLLQGKLAGAGDETLRFAVNTTVGLLGFFDPAANWGIEPSREDFGQVFAAWGWNPSAYLMLPLLGPSTPRDALGLLPDSLTDPASYFFPARPVFTFNELTDSVEAYKRFTRSTYDPYAISRIVWLFNRSVSVEDFEYLDEKAAAAESLEAMFLNIKDPDFPTSIQSREALLPSTGRKLPYNFKLQDKPAPLVFILPGLGGHRYGGSALALAEMAYRRGFSVAILSNAYNWEFMERASTAPMPGHTPVDARDVHVALDAVSRDLAAQFPHHITKRVLMGYSMGAFHAFFIAAAEQSEDNKLVSFDRYVTLDVPVQLRLGMEELDAFYNAPLAFPPQERATRIKNIIQKTLSLAKGQLEPDVGLPLSEIEAQFIIGLTYRLTLATIIYNSQTRHDLGILQTDRGWFRRSPAYEEILDYSWLEYVYGFVIPYYMRRDSAIKNAAQMFKLNDLRSIGDPLKASGKIRHFANRNDFLVAKEDIEWITNALGEKNVQFFPSGGHLGGLHKPEVQDEIMQTLADLL
jgi:ABC-type transporter lipoprotein component MlaA